MPACGGGGRGAEAAGREEWLTQVPSKVPGYLGLSLRVPKEVSMREQHYWDLARYPGTKATSLDEILCCRFLVTLFLAAMRAACVAVPDPRSAAICAGT
eukprot:1311926-Rhodomonas_salina.4